MELHDAFDRKYVRDQNDKHLIYLVDKYVNKLWKIRRGKVITYFKIMTIMRDPFDRDKICCHAYKLRQPDPDTHYISYEFYNFKNFEAEIENIEPATNAEWNKAIDESIEKLMKLKLT